MSDAPAPTVRENIAAALTAVLVPLVEPGAFDIDPEGDPCDFPALELFDHGDQLIERECGLERRSADFELNGYVERAGGSDAAAERNRLHARAVAAIMADDTLGGIVEQVDMGDLRKTVAMLSSAGRMSFSQAVRIQFTTQRTNPALPA